MTGSVETHHLADDGIIPNNARLPLVIYRQVFTPDGDEPEARIQEIFQSHGWEHGWVDGIFDWHHYHSTAHEVLGIARGWARVRFGGPGGITADVRAGDAVVIPAGVGHCRLAAEDLSVVGAYPEGQDWDMCGTDPAERERALANIPAVALPETDPVFGPEGPLLTCWRD